MALLELRLSPSMMPDSQENDIHHDSPSSTVSATDRSSSQPPSAVTKRRKSMFVDTIPKAGDNYNWLKYGEKLLRDRKTLRHYYRCSSKVDSGCTAKKMVDVLVTSGSCNWHYREDHNHPPPASSLSMQQHQQNQQHQQHQQHQQTRKRDSSGSPVPSARRGTVDHSLLIPRILPLLSASSSQDLPSSAFSAALAAALLNRPHHMTQSSPQQANLRSPSPASTTNSPVFTFGGSTVALPPSRLGLKDLASDSHGTSAPFSMLGPIGSSSTPMHSRMTASPPFVSQHLAHADAGASLAKCLALMSTRVSDLSRNPSHASLPSVTASPLIKHNDNPSEQHSAPPSLEQLLLPHKASVCPPRANQASAQQQRQSNDAAFTSGAHRISPNHEFLLSHLKSATSYSSDRAAGPGGRWACDLRGATANCGEERNHNAVKQTTPVLEAATAEEEESEGSSSSGKLEQSVFLSCDGLECSWLAVGASSKRCRCYA